MTPKPGSENDPKSGVVFPPMGIGNGRRERGHGPTHGAPFSGVGFVDAYLILKPIPPQQQMSDKGPRPWRQRRDRGATGKRCWSATRATRELQRTNAERQRSGKGSEAERNNPKATMCNSPRVSKTKVVFRPHFRGRKRSSKIKYGR